MNNFVNFIDTFVDKNNILFKMKRYVDLLLIENEKMNLIAKSTIDNIWNRHILDCAQLSKYVSGNIVDLGSGSGLPGLVLGIMLPDSNFILIEKSPKKSIFLNKIIEELNLNNVSVVNNDVKSAKIDVIKFKPNYITCRAFKNTLEIINLIKFYNIKVSLVLLKGKNFLDEINKNIEYKTHKSIVNDEGFILLIEI